MQTFYSFFEGGKQTRLVFQVVDKDLWASRLSCAPRLAGHIDIARTLALRADSLGRDLLIPAAGNRIAVRRGRLQAVLHTVISFVLLRDDLRSE